MTNARRETPAWLLKTVAAVCIAWCATGVLVLLLPEGGVRRVIRLADFSHDATLGTLPWRVTIEDVDGALEAGTLQGKLLWIRRSDLGFPLPIFKKRYQFVLGGDAPAGVEPLSLEDAESLLRAAYATLPTSAEPRQIYARNEFLLALQPRSALEEITMSYLLFNVTVPLAAIGALLAVATLRKRRAPQPA